MFLRILHIKLRNATYLSEKYPRGRSFIRPSGTEDVIRVYVEASTQEAADSLANSVAKLVDQHLGFASTR